MKHLIYLLLIAATCFIGCSGGVEPPYKKAKLRHGNAYFKEITIDTCQYIYDANINLSVPAVLTHKGNCNNPIHNPKIKTNE